MLSINAPAFGWPAGTGLRWSLPLATNLRGLARGGEPRGWPDHGYRIYRASLTIAAKKSCTELTIKVPVGERPLALGAGISVDWVSRGSPTGTLSDEINSAGAAVFFLSRPALAVSMRVAPEEKGEAHLRVVTYAINGMAVSTLDKNNVDSTEVILAGPSIIRIEIQVRGISIQEVCIWEANEDWLAQTAPLAKVLPSTDPAQIGVLNPALSGEEVSRLADWIQQAVVDIDVVVVEVGTGSPTEEVSPILDTPVIDLLQIVSLEPWMATALGLLYWDPDVLPDPQVYAIVAAWAGVEYVWFTPPILPSSPDLFDLPTNMAISLELLPPRRSVSAMGPTGVSSTAVGLTWPVHSPHSLPARPGDYAVRFLIKRASAEPKLSPEERSRVFSMDSLYMEIGPPMTASGGRVQALDIGVPDGIHVWEVTGLDLFGRPSRPVRSAEFETWDRLPPPAPDNVRGAFLSRAALPAGEELSPDPFMTASHAAWLQAHPETPSWLYIGFDWPPTHFMAEPDTREFRLYLHPSRSVPRSRSRIVSLVPDEALGIAHIQFDPPVANLPAFRGGTLNDGVATFEMVNTDEFSCVVRMRVGPQRYRRVTDPVRGERLEPASDAPTYLAPQMGREVTLVGDLRDPALWTERIAIVPRHDPLRSQVAAVSQDLPAGEGTSRKLHIRLAHPMRHPDPEGGIFFEGGWLVVRGVPHRVSLLLTEGAHRRLPAGGVECWVEWAAGEVRLPVGEEALFYPGYGVYRRHASLRIATESVAYALVTATAVKASRAPDAVDHTPWAGDSTWQEAGQPRRGFEGATAPPATIIDVRRELPISPTPVAPLLMGWPDASGHASFVLRWPVTTNTRYIVLRSLEEADDIRSYSIVNDRPTGAADLSSRLTDEQPETEFTLLGPGFWFDNTRNQMVFVDRLPGIGRARYFYRIQAMDEAGNIGRPGAPTRPVVSRVDALPLEPVLTDARLGNRSITLLWEHPPDGSVTRYAVYVARTESDLAAYEMLPVTRVIGPNIVLGQTPDEDRRDAQTANAIWGWIGNGLPVGQLIIVVMAERPLPSGVVLWSPPAVRRLQVIETSPPTPPILLQLERHGSEARVQWRAAEEWYESLVEWRPVGDEVWRSAGGWRMASLPREAAIVVPPGAIEVRVRVRNGIAVSPPARSNLPEAPA